MRLLARLFLPGHAQLRNGQRKKAWAVAGGLFLLLLLACVTPWLRTALGLVSFLAVLIGALLAAWWDGRRRKGTVEPARWELAVLALPCWLLVGSLLLEPAVIGLRVYRIPAGNVSCAPTLVGGDRFLVDMRMREAERGELVVFLAPDGEHDYVKRVVAVGGDVVRADATGVYVNDRLVARDGGKTFGPLTIPEGQCFAVGDNLPQSRDCRHFGPIENGAIKGRPLYVFWSDAWDRIGTTLH